MLTNAFLAPERDHATRLVDATAAAVKLAECLVEPWFRARCALGAGYPFQHSDDEGEEEQVAVSGKTFLTCGFGSRCFQPLPVRLLRSVITRFWGGGQANDAESSDEEHQLRDTEGVD